MVNPAALLMPVLLVGIGYWSWRQYQGAQSLLEDWARANHLIVLAKKRGTPPLSLWFGTSKYQHLYHVEVLDEATHRIRRA